MTENYSRSSLSDQIPLKPYHSHKRPSNYWELKQQYEGLQIDLGTFGFLMPNLNFNYDLNQVEGNSRGEKKEKNHIK